MPTPTNESSPPARRGRGRPRKEEIKALTPGNRGKRGRPPGDAAIINEYKARMLASPKSAAVLEKILDTALDDDHKHQGVCMKLVAERLVPKGYFEKDGVSKGKGNVHVSISAFGQTIDVTEEVEEGDFIDIPTISEYDTDS